MPNFYKEFPKIDYTFEDGSVHTLTDLNVKYTLSEIVKAAHDVFYPFGWRDSDRPDSLADKYYDSSNFYWLVLMSNDVFDINHDLPIPMESFDRYLTAKYKDVVIENGGTENLESILDYLTTTTHHHEDADGYIIDHSTYLTDGAAKTVSLYEHEFNENEAKRQIRLLEVSKASKVQYELETKLRDLKARLV